jgi:hypothetical protein
LLQSSQFCRATSTFSCDIAYSNIPAALSASSKSQKKRASAILRSASR